MAQKNVFTMSISVKQMVTVSNYEHSEIKKKNLIQTTIITADWITSKKLKILWKDVMVLNVYQNYLF